MIIFLTDSILAPEISSLTCGGPNLVTIQGNFLGTAGAGMTIYIGSYPCTSPVVITPNTEVQCTTGAPGDGTLSISYSYGGQDNSLQPPVYYFGCAIDPWAYCYDWWATIPNVVIEQPETDYLNTGLDDVGTLTLTWTWPLVKSRNFTNGQLLVNNCTAAIDTAWTMFGDCDSRENHTILFLACTHFFMSWRY